MTDNDPWQAGDTFKAHEMVLELQKGPDQAAGLMGHEVSPVLPSRIVEGGFYDFEVNRAVRVSFDE